MSFGVTMWEVFSLGKCIPNKEAVEKAAKNFTG